MILSPSIVLPVRENEVLGCLGVFYHSKWNKRDCKTSRTIRRGEYPAGTVKKDKPNFRRCRKNCKFERGILYYKKCSGKRLQQAQIDSQELQNGGCMSGVRRKRRGSWGHAMGEQLGVTLEGIQPWRRFVPGFIGETWLRRFENMWRSAPNVRGWNANFIKSNMKLHPIPVQPKVWCQVSRYIECSFSQQVCLYCLYCWPWYS